MTQVRSYFLVNRLWQYHYETSQCVSKLVLPLSVKIISKSLNRKNLQFGLDRAHVFIVDRYVVCKRESFFLVLFVAQFLSRYCLGIKADLFSARMQVISISFIRS